VGATYTDEVGNSGGGREGSGERDRPGEAPKQRRARNAPGEGSVGRPKRALPHTMSSGSPTANGSTQSRRTANAGNWMRSRTAGPKIAPRARKAPTYTDEPTSRRGWP